MQHSLVVRVGLVVAASVALLAACTSPATSPEPKPSADSSPASQPSGSPAPKQIWYATQDHPEVQITSRESVSQLTGAPQDFKDFIAQRWQQNSTKECAATISVRNLRLDGFASGAVDTCKDSYAALWAVQEGKWGEIVGTAQAMWDCAALESYKVPDSIVGKKCVSGDNGGVIQDYEQK